MSKITGETAYLNHIATAVPDYDIHEKFIRFAPQLLSDEKSRRMILPISRRLQIDHRYSVLQSHANDEWLDRDGFYNPEKMPGTEERMYFYQDKAFGLAQKALSQLDLNGVTHVLVTSCTGFYAPGLDSQIIEHYGLSDSIERTMIGFMGCYAAINALRLARHIVRSEPEAKCLMLNLELCTLHLQRCKTLDDIIPFLLFADGCAASIVSTRAAGLALKGFKPCLLPDSQEQITWSVGNNGFNMMLSNSVPSSLSAELPAQMPAILGGAVEDIDHWAIHPGGRSILDAVQKSIGLSEDSMAPSRHVLRDYGNMSSPTIMFVLKQIMQSEHKGEGCALAFGPGLGIESMRFSCVGEG